MKYKMNDTERAALAELKNAVEVFNAAIAAFDAAVPQCGYGGDGWIEHNWDVIYEIEAEGDVDGDEDDEE
jgi:hypothetical protein